jgi:hypothetical protein
MLLMALLLMLQGLAIAWRSLLHLIYKDQDIGT